MYVSILPGLWFSFAKTPCTNMSDKLSAAQRDSLQNNIKRQLKTERLNILEFLKSKIVQSSI